MPAARQDLPPRSVLRWLVVLYVLVGLTVIVGGITRLTGSGLSMVVWQPLIGIVPPLSAEAWDTTFEMYKATPQYQQVNHWMALDDFRWIFLWEYLHRVIARSVGIVCLVPMLWFAWRGALRGAWAWRAFAAFLLGGAQGALGWFMVQSGLVDIPAVSHLRLAAHLSLAFFVGMFLLWMILDLTRPDLQGTRTTSAARQAWALIALVSLQIVYGAFMAGTRAGYLFATFPDMHGAWIGPGSAALEPLWRNLVENPVAIHTIHRWLGWLVLGAALAFVANTRRRTRDDDARRALTLVAVLVAAQFATGALTVMLHVQIAVATLHQILAYLLLSALVMAAHRLRSY
jgi:cytochrome c oxidase assembly protein subunit 15